MDESLNPCFSGGWSRRATQSAAKAGDTLVLILVLVEDGLGDKIEKPFISNEYMS